MTPASIEPLHVLVLCTGNSARSILCEALINHYGQSHWRAFSAGSHPKGTVHPVALYTLQEHHIDTAGFRSKSWDEFVTPNALRMDIVITVCDNAASEVCPVWLGSPLKIHWGIPDPAAARDDQQYAAFETAFQTLQRRVKRLIELPIAAQDRDILQTELRKLAVVF